jgi:hypothetical protein
MTPLMVTFRTFSFLDFLADLLQKSISVASNLFACCVFSVHVSAPYSRILWTRLLLLWFFFLYMKYDKWRWCRYARCLLCADSYYQHFG